MLPARDGVPERLRGLFATDWLSASGAMLMASPLGLFVADARATGSEVVLPHKSQLSDALVARVHAAGIKLATWVVDEPEELRELARFDLYGVGSNRPGVLLEAIADGLLD